MPSRWRCSPLAVAFDAWRARRHELDRPPAGAAVRFLAADPRLRSGLPALLHGFGARQAPGRTKSTRGEAMAFADEIVAQRRALVMLCGGEPLTVPHFLDVAEYLGRAGVHAEDRNQRPALRRAVAARLARLPIRSIQISLDGDTQEVYARQRPGASLAKTHAACRAVRRAGLAAGSDLRADPAEHRSGRGSDRPGALARRVPLQHRAVDAHRPGGAAVAQDRAVAGGTMPNSARCCAAGASH